MCQRKDRLSHHQNLTSLSAFGSILKDFWEPVSVNVRLVLVEDDKTLYTMATNVPTKDRLSHHQNLTSLSVFDSILKDFWEPMSVNVGVVLLVEDYMTLYILIEFGTHGVYECTKRKDRLLHYQNLASLSALGSIF